MPQELYSDGSPSRTEVDEYRGPLTRFADDATIAELERQARRITELESGIRSYANEQCPHCRRGVERSDDGIHRNVVWHRIGNGHHSCAVSRLLIATNM